MDPLSQLDPGDLANLMAMSAAQRLGAIIRLNTAHRYATPLDALRLLAGLEELARSTMPKAPHGEAALPDSAGWIPGSSDSPSPAAGEEATFAMNRKEQ